MPIAVKDLCNTKGIPTAAGMAIYKDYRPDEDATVVARLRDAGAVLLGKLQMTEGAFGQHHPSIDSAGKSLECSALDGRVIERFGRRHGGRPLFRVARHGYAGINPIPIYDERAHWFEAQLGSSESGGHIRACPVLGPCRPHDPQR